jgi:hypothetical protein
MAELVPFTCASCGPVLERFASAEVNVLVWSALPIA